MISRTYDDDFSEGSCDEYDTPHAPFGIPHAAAHFPCDEMLLHYFRQMLRGFRAEYTRGILPDDFGSMRFSSS